ncbi:MAG: methylated-DNA--[protein]-cysteine S-methyltransferase [Phycisphaerales bacterium]|nr:methylated-DNA--[protein]-cysteine S-methyltransferase [Phycisphaerales bacterium]
MLAGATACGICLLEFADRRGLPTEYAALRAQLGLPGERATAGEANAAACGHLDALAAELAAYFEQKLSAFTIPLDPRGTPFDRRVWDELLRIPYGATMSYGQLAAKVGSPGGARAVGRANGRNCIAIVIPCHRVIESTGALRGYGGGLDRKRALLELEGALAGKGEGLFAAL